MGHPFDFPKNCSIFSLEETATKGDEHASGKNDLFTNNGLFAKKVVSQIRQPIFWQLSGAHFSML